MSSPQSQPLRHAIFPFSPNAPNVLDISQLSPEQRSYYVRFVLASGLNFHPASGMRPLDWYREETYHLARAARCSLASAPLNSNVRLWNTIAIMNTLSPKEKEASQKRVSPTALTDSLPHGPKVELVTAGDAEDQDRLSGSTSGQRDRNLSDLGIALALDEGGKEVLVTTRTGTAPTLDWLRCNSSYTHAIGSSDVKSHNVSPHDQSVGFVALAQAAFCKSKPHKAKGFMSKLELEQLPMSKLTQLFSDAAQYVSAYGKCISDCAMADEELSRSKECEESKARASRILYQEWALAQRKYSIHMGDLVILQDLVPKHDPAAEIPKRSHGRPSNAHLFRETTGDWDVPFVPEVEEAR